MVFVLHRVCIEKDFLFWQVDVGKGLVFDKTILGDAVGEDIGHIQYGKLATVVDKGIVLVLHASGEYEFFDIRLHVRREDIANGASIQVNSYDCTIGLRH